LPVVARDFNVAVVMMADETDLNGFSIRAGPFAQGVPGDWVGAAA